MRTGDVALTFDVEHPDGPRCPPGVAERIVSLLAGNDVRASFFLQGRWVSAYPELARQMASDGHVIGNHSHSHTNLRNLSPAGLVDDIRAAEEAIANSAGADPRPWFRCPHGTHSHTPQLAQTLRNLHYDDAHWNITAEDWETDASAPQVAARVMEGMAAHPGGAVVLLHSWPAVVPDVLLRVIDHVGEHGGQFVTLADLAHDPSWLRSAR